MSITTRKAMLAEWGERCPDFDPDCPACRAWEAFDAAFARRRSERDVDGLIDEILDRNPDFEAALAAVIAKAKG